MAAKQFFTSNVFKAVVVFVFIEFSYSMCLYHKYRKKMHLLSLQGRTYTKKAEKTPAALKAYNLYHKMAMRRRRAPAAEGAPAGGKVIFLFFTMKY